MKLAAIQLTGFRILQRLFCLFFLSCVPVVSADELRGVNAGVIPWACKGDEVVYLLAYDPHGKRQGWGAFGGRPDGHEKASETAIRELYEETNCAFTQSELKELTLSGPSGSNGFYSFVARVPFRSPEDIAKPRQCKDVERGFWVWVRHHELITSLKSDKAIVRVPLMENPDVKIPIWSGAVESLKQGLKDNLFPEGNACH